MHIFEGDEGAAQTPEKTVLGHEFSGIIEEIGGNVKDFKIGDRIDVDPNKLCGECKFCKDGIGHFCENMIGIGTTVMLFGLVRPDDIMEIKPFSIFKKELTIKASFINPYTQGRTLSLINSKKIDVKTPIYKTDFLEELPVILSTPSKGKIIIEP